VHRCVHQGTTVHHVFSGHLRCPSARQVGTVNQRDCPRASFTGNSAIELCQKGGSSVPRPYSMSAHARSPCQYMLDAAYPAVTAIKDHPRQPLRACLAGGQAWLAARPEGRSQFVFTPKHGSWLNLVERFFAKAAHSVLRHIRVSSKHELKQRNMEFIHDLNRDPVIHRWHYQIDTAA
jgi:hypothetical protein